MFRQRITLQGRFLSGSDRFGPPARRCLPHDLLFKKVRKRRKGQQEVDDAKIEKRITYLDLPARDARMLLFEGLCPMRYGHGSVSLRQNRVRLVVRQFAPFLQAILQVKPRNKIGSEPLGENWRGVIFSEDSSRATPQPGPR